MRGHIRKNLYENQEIVEGEQWGVGAHGQLTRGSNGLSPETNTNAQRILLVSIALSLAQVVTKLLELLAQSPIFSPVPSLR